MRVILVTNHTHAGQQYKPGDEIDMSPADASWYRETVLNERFAATALTETALGRLTMLALGGKT